MSDRATQLCIYIETESGQRCPVGFDDGGARFAGFLADMAPDYKTPRELARFVDLARPLQIDFGPFSRWANEEDPNPEEFEQESLHRVARRLGITPHAYFEREQQRQEHAWQAPQALLTAARAMRAALHEEANPPFFEQFGYRELDDDLGVCLHMASWAIDLGERIRIVMM